MSGIQETWLKIKTIPGANIIVWGLVLVCHAVANSFQAFFVLRFILGGSGNLQLVVAKNYAGMCESCVAPILISIITMFYRKDEQVSNQSFYK